MKINIREEDKKTVEHQFDSLCKIALTGEIINYRKELSRKREREASFHGIQEPSHIDLKQIEQNSFVFNDMVFVFEDDLLYQAMTQLSDEKRTILLFFYFLDMTDQEIGQALKIIRRTVNHKRNRALSELRKMMEETSQCKIN